MTRSAESGDYVGFLSNCRLCSCSWFDVVIHAEEVCRIVFVFENHKTIIIGAVGRAGESVILFHRVIHIRT